VLMDHTRVTSSMTDEQLQAVLSFLLKDRMCNYGYDRGEWSRIRGQRRRAKAACCRLVAEGGIRALDWENAGSRLVIGPGGPDYHVGQSANEEVTNVLRRLARMKGGWAS